MHVHLDVEDQFMARLLTKVGGTSTAFSLTREALTLLNWAVEEASSGRLIVSTKPDGSEPRLLNMPILQAAAATAGHCLQPI